MSDLLTWILYALCVVVIALSWRADKVKTKKSLLKAWKAFEGILPQFIGILILVGILLALLNPKTITALLGGASGWWGVLLAALLGAITLIPGFIAFPLAAMLMRSGAGTMQMGAFISTLMMVGVVTAPAERKYFGWRMTILRNALAFAFSFLVAWTIGVVVR